VNDAKDDIMTISKESVMASMVIRNIPDDVFERFKARAKAKDKSAEQMAREVITKEAGMTREEAWAEIDAIRARSKPVSGQEMIDQIRWDRDHNLGKTYPGIDE
jgi:plasmid stability protein